MQEKMKKYQLEKKQIDALLERLLIATISMVGENGYPYAVPIHFVYEGEKIYFHGLSKGQKIDCITADNRVCFTAYEMKKLYLAEEGNPCGTGTQYESVVILGNTRILEAFSKKEQILTKIIEKYSPQVTNKKMPENMINGTCVVEITPVVCTGKYRD